MTTTHIKHLKIVTLDAAGSIHEDADLVIRDGVIDLIGKAPEELQADEVIDGSGRVALPGLGRRRKGGPARCGPKAGPLGWAATGR